MAIPSRRLIRLESLKIDAWYRRIYTRLNLKEREFVRQWIVDHDHLPRGEWEYAVNRIYIGDVNLPRHKRWLDITELLVVADSEMPR